MKKTGKKAKAKAKGPAPRTEAEILASMAAQKEADRKRAIVRDRFYPALVSASESIEDAKMFVSSIGAIIMDKFLQDMKDKKFSELGMKEGLDPAGKKYAEMAALLSIFDDETVFTARQIIEGMRGEIDQCISAEMRGRPLDTLKTNFY